MIKKAIVIFMIFATCIFSNINAMAKGELIKVCVEYDQMLPGIQLFSEGVSGETMQTLKERLYNAASNRSEEFTDISDLNIPMTDLNVLQSAFSEAVKNNPEFFYVTNKYYYSYAEGGEFLRGVQLIYNTHDDEDSKNFYSKVNYIIASVVEDEMSDAEKALVLHDYIINNTTYTYEEDVDRMLYPEYVEGDVYNAYAVIMDGFGVCSGYSMAYNILLNRMGIETKYVTSIEHNHGWSLVKIDGMWYHVDVTWDDPVSQNHPAGQIVNHANFLLSDDGIHSTGHNSWETQTPECNDKTYESENYSFFLTRTEMKYKDGKYLYQDFREIFEDVYGVPIYTINGKRYVLEYAATNFDGSGRVVITEETYTSANNESKKIFSPIKYNGKVASEATKANINDSLLYVKGFNAADEEIYIACYAKDGKLLKIAKATVSELATDDYAEMSITDVASSTNKIKIMYWDKDSICPIDDYIEIK